MKVNAEFKYIVRRYVGKVRTEILQTMFDDEEKAMRFAAEFVRTAAQGAVLSADVELRIVIPIATL